MQTNTSELITKNSSGVESNGYTYYSAISANGQFVTFSSLASDLVADDTNGIIDQFMFDRSAGVMKRINTRTDGSELTVLGVAFSPAVTEDGNKVYLLIKPDVIDSSSVTNQYQLYVKNLSDNSLSVVSVNTDGEFSDAGVAGGVVVSSQLDTIYFLSNATNLNPSNGIQSNVYVADLSEEVECESFDVEREALCAAIGLLTRKNNGEIRNRFFNKKGNIKKKFRTLLDSEGEVSVLCDGVSVQ